MARKINKIRPVIPPVAMNRTEAGSLSSSSADTASNAQRLEGDFQSAISCYGMAIGQRPSLRTRRVEMDETEFKYHQRIKGDDGKDQRKLGILWQRVFGNTKPPFAGYGYWVIPVLECHSLWLDQRAYDSMTRFMGTGITLFESPAPSFPGSCRVVKRLLCVGISDGTVWEVAVLESLLKFWACRLLPWWRSVAMGHQYHELPSCSVLFSPEAKMASYYQDEMEGFIERVTTVVIRDATVLWETSRVGLGIR